jgi:hypothetical protein
MLSMDATHGKRKAPRNPSTLHARRISRERNHRGGNLSVAYVLCFSLACFTGASIVRYIFPLLCAGRTTILHETVHYHRYAPALSDLTLVQVGIIAKINQLIRKLYLGHRVDHRLQFLFNCTLGKQGQGPSSAIKTSARHKKKGKEWEKGKTHGNRLSRRACFVVGRAFRCLCVTFVQYAVCRSENSVCP